MIADLDISALLGQILFSYDGYDVTLGRFLSIPLFVVVGLFVTQTITRVTASVLQRRDVNADAIQIVRRATMILGIVIVIITTLDLLQIPLTAFAFVSGAIAIGLGFGAQNIINNFISGWILMWERPIRINDFIELEGASGTVEQINTRSTRIKRVDGVHMLVPNSRLLEETVINWTLVDRLLRSVVRVGVSYGSDVEQVKRILTDIMECNDDVLSTPAPNVIFEDFGDSSLVFDIYFWVQAEGERNARRVRSDIRFAIYAGFAAEGVVIAFPQRDIHVDGQLSLTQLPADSDRR